MPLLFPARLLFVTAVGAESKPSAASAPVWKSGTHHLRFDGRELTGFSKVSEQHGFVAVYLEGTRDLGLDPRAVFATGFSNRGDMSFFLSAQREPFVAAIASVTGTMMASWAKDFRTAARIPVLAVNTRDDKTTLWDGDLNNRDGWGAYLGTEAVLDLCAKGLALERSERVDLTKTIELRRWSTANHATEARLCVLEVGGHHWPRTLGYERETTAEVIWRFFDAHRSKSH